MRMFYTLKKIQIFKKIFGLITDVGWFDDGYQLTNKAAFFRLNLHFAVRSKW